MTGIHPADVLIGDSPLIREARALIAKIAPTRLNVLIEGPTGSGKELAAEALHQASGRQGGFVACNVCAIPDAMFEDTLFGHARGAFSGAIAEHRGYMAEADGGTLFLDELSGLARHNQVKLLRALETRRFRPVGARADAMSDFRLIAATNMPLASLTESGELRLDLAHRVATAIVNLPALRDRLADIPMLAAHFLARLDASCPMLLSSDAVCALQAHDWPGNVRELRNVVERAAALASGRALEQEDISRALWVTGRESLGPDSRAKFLQRRLLEVLHENDWDITATSRALGVHRTTLWRRLRQIRDAHLGTGEGDPPSNRSSLA